MMAENAISGVEARKQRLFGAHMRKIHLRTDHLFVWLMPLQWVAGIAGALWISPTTWAGSQSAIHPHIWAALVLGGAISFWPVFCALRWPGAAATRQMIGIGQMLMAALLIHLSGGRIETHFHIFGSLAFLAFYRDWRVLVTASAVVALDHCVRGVYFPLSVFGILTVSPYRWLEHVGWVLFEDIFLIIAIHQSLAEMRSLAERQAKLEALNTGIERTVAERTAELTREIAERKEAERRLLEASRRAGMAEVATNVLHNVGNVLNSVNISHAVILDKLRNSGIVNVARAADLLREHEGDLPAFLTTHPTGSKLPDFLGKLANWLLQEHGCLLAEMEVLGRNIDHVKKIVALQQNYARAGGLQETVALASLAESALQINGAALAAHRIEIVRDFAQAPPASLDKHRVMQILVNLVSNARHALVNREGSGKRLTVRTSRGNGRLLVSVSDNGVGIASENLTRIFAHGFTTKRDGHGYGLHGSAIAATDMGGSLTAESLGPGQGATFTLELPLCEGAAA